MSQPLRNLRKPMSWLCSSIAIVAALALPCPSRLAVAQEPPATDQPATAGDHDLVDQDLVDLVTRLGADSFRTREAATARLLAIGPRALPVLRKLQESSDPETKRRIEVITTRLLQEDFEQRVRAFLDREPEATLPGWNYFARRTRDRQAIRELFVSLTRRRPGVMDLLDGTDRERTEALTLLGQAIGEDRKQFSFEPQLGDAIGLLVLMTDPGVPTAAADDNQLMFLLRRPEVTIALTDPELAELLRQFVGTWMEQVHPPGQIEALAFAMERDFPQATTLAKKVLADDPAQIDPERIEFALMTLARFGTPVDNAVVKPFLDDKRTTASEQIYVDPTGRILKSQVRDQAMATIACLYDRPLRDLGFPTGQEHRLTGFARETVGFPEGEAGEEARKRVRESIDQLISQQPTDQADQANSSDGAVK